MKINILEKFDLLEKLEAISESCSDHKEINSICRTAIHDIRKSFDINKVNGYINKLNSYSWVKDIESFNENLTQFVNENKYSIQLEQINNVLKNSTFSHTYKKAIKEIESILPLDENDIKSELHRLNNYSYIPQIDKFLKEFEISEFAIAKNNIAEVEKYHLSPVMTLENTNYVFHLNGKDYEVNESLSDIKEYKGNLSTEYTFALQSLNKFMLESDDSFSMNLKSGHYIKIGNGETPKMFINETEYLTKESFMEGLVTSGALGYFDKTNINLIEFMVENVNSLVNIEFVRTIKTLHEHLKYSFIKVDNKILLNKVDSFEHTNEMLEITGTNLDETIDSFKNKLNIDITSLLENMKVNFAVVELTDIVNGLSKSMIKENREELSNAIDKVDKLVLNFTEEDLKSNKELIDKYNSIKECFKSPKVDFVLETINKFESSDDIDGRDEVLEALHLELDTLLK